MITLLKDGKVDIESANLDELRDLLMDANIHQVFDLRQNTLEFNRMHMFMKDIRDYYCQHDPADVVDAVNTCMEQLETRTEDILKLDPLDPEQKKDLDDYASQIQDYADGSDVMD